jgi:hypothetical protein
MAVISYVQQQLLADLPLNPAMKHRDQRIEINALLVSHEKFHIDVLKIHGNLFLDS